MEPNHKRKLIGGILLGGGLVAAGAAYAGSGGKGPGTAAVQSSSFVSAQAPAFRGPVRGAFGGGGHGDETDAAVSYLGLTAAQIQTQLESGKTLAQIADATQGKSAAGLVQALVAAEKTELAAAVTAGKLTQAQADQIAPTLTQRVTDLVNGVRPAGHRDGGRHDDELGAAASYLGLTAAQIQTQLESGKTLAQIADATQGKSAAGLVQALVAAKKTELAAAVKSGKLTQARADQIAATLTQRVTDRVNGVRPSGRFHGFRESHRGASA